MDGDVTTARPLTSTTSSPPVLQQFDATAGLGIFGATATTEILSSATLRAELAALEEPPPSPSFAAATPSPPPTHPLTGFDGLPLSSTSHQLEARCQTALSQTLSRDPSQPPQLFADPLDNLQLAPLNTTDDVRLVYLIGVGARPFAHLVASRLLYALYSPVHLFLIHIDVKADKAAAQAMYTLAKQHNSNVRVLQARRLVQWGMFSMVSPFLDALHTILTANLSFDFFINLSDADLSLRTDTEITHFLSKHKGRSFINVHGEGGEQLRGATAFINAHTIVECGGYGFILVNKSHDAFPLTHGCCIGRSGPAAFAESLPLPQHPHLEGKQMHTGSQWAILSAAFCHHILRGEHSADWLNAFERRLVPDESILQTILMHSPIHKRLLVNHNLRWIDWPHSHGDPNEYWNALGARKYIGGPRVLNSSDLSAVFASPYIFARKVDHEVDPDVLRLWDEWMAKKRAGADMRGQQSPIAHAPGDPGLSLRFRAPGLDVLSSTVPQRRRKLARVEFEDGSDCGCGDGCGALSGGCCASRLCGRPSAPLVTMAADDNGAPAAADDGDAAEADDDGSPPQQLLKAAVAELSAIRLAKRLEVAEAARVRAQKAALAGRLPLCPLANSSAISLPGGNPLTVSFLNRAVHPILLFVLDYSGNEHRMGLIQKPDQAVAFDSAENVTWRVRAMSGELLLECTPVPPEGQAAWGGELDANQTRTSEAEVRAEVEVGECAFRTAQNLNRGF